MNVFERNSAYQPGQLVSGEGAYGIGGGVMVDVALDVLVAQNTFEGNYAVRANGEGNTSWGGGGGLTAVATDRLSVTENVFVQNVANSMGGTGYGGGIATFRTPQIYAAENRLEANVALGVGPNGQGGGMYLNGSENMATADFRVINNQVISNVASVQLTFADNTYCAGGGLRLWLSEAAQGGQLTLTDNRVEGNAGVQQHG